MNLEQIRQDLKNEDAILLDVREQDEWDEGHLATARLVPLSALDEEDIPSDLPTDKIIYTHCRKGGRAEVAANILKDKGYNAIPLKYAFEDLQKELFSL